MTTSSRIDLADAWVLTGASASGKTAIGLELALRLGAEILSLDSMAVFRGLDVGTAKPTRAEQARVPHHLLDLAEPHEPFSLSRWLDAARASLADLRARGKRPLFIGGTPLYLRALLRGVSTGPPPNEALRRAWRRRIEAEGAEPLVARLREVDPAAAARLHPSDIKRLIRALEVFEATGRPLTQCQTHDRPLPPNERPLVWVLDWPPEVLARRIDARVETMFAGGLLEEVQRLMSSPSGLGTTATQAIAYREVMEFFAGVRGLDKTKALVATRTRQLAKRQRTWFRSLEECRFCPMVEPFEPATIAEQLLRESR